MNTNQERETVLAERIAEAYPPAATGEVPQSLEWRVAALASAHGEWQRRRAARRRTLRAWAGAVTTAAVLGAAVVAGPSVRGAYALGRMADRIDDARSVHMQTFLVRPGRAPERTGETWYQGGRWRIADRQGVRLWSGGVLWTFDPVARTAMRERKEGGPYTYNLAGFSLSAILREKAREGWLRRTEVREVGEEAGENGTRLRLVALRQAPDRGRILLAVDPVSDRPVRWEYQTPTNGGGWAAQTVSRLTYDAPLDSGLFAARFPKGTRVFDMDAGRADWQRRLSRPVYARTVGERTVAIRDFRVNAEGDVFLLFTDGQAPDDLWGGTDIRLSDDRGTEYVQSWRFQPYAGKSRTNADQGYVFNGERLRGALWVPLETEPTPWRSRRFTLHVRAERALRHDHGTPPAGPHASDEEEFEVTLPVATPSAVLSPEYAPYIASIPRLASEWEMERSQSRAHWYAACDEWPAAERHCRKALAAGEAYRRDVGQPVSMADTWFDLYQALDAQGKRAEAREALDRAAEDDVYGNLTTKIREARMKAGG
jgi:hypothetical protein